MGTNAGRSMLLSRSISRMPLSPLCVEGGISFNVGHYSHAEGSLKTFGMAVQSSTLREA
jgi:hypothetical protein